MRCLGPRQGSRDQRVQGPLPSSGGPSSRWEFMCRCPHSSWSTHHVRCRRGWHSDDLSAYSNSRVARGRSSSSHLLVWCSQELQGVFSSAHSSCTTLQAAREHNNSSSLWGRRSLDLQMAPPSSSSGKQSSRMVMQSGGR